MGIQGIQGMQETFGSGGIKGSSATGGGGNLSISLQDSGGDRGMGPPVGLTISAEVRAYLLSGGSLDSLRVL